MNWRLVFTKARWLSLNVFVVWTCLNYIIMKRWSFRVRHNFWRVYNGIILQVTHIKIDRRFCYYAMLWSSYEKLALAVALQKKVWNFYSKLFQKNLKIVLKKLLFEIYSIDTSKLHSKCVQGSAKFTWKWMKLDASGLCAQTFSRSSCKDLFLKLPFWKICI